MGQTWFCCKVMLWPWPSSSDANVACYTSSQYGDHYLWNSFKIWLQITKLYGPDMILLQGDAVTLTLQVVTQMLHATRRFIWLSFLLNSFKIRLQIQLFKAFRITGSSGSVDGICWKIIKQYVHFVHLTCVLLTSTLLKFVTDFSKVCASSWQGTSFFYNHTWNTLPLQHFLENCISVICNHYHSNMQVCRNFLGGN